MEILNGGIRGWRCGVWGLSLFLNHNIGNKEKYRKKAERMIPSEPPYKVQTISIFNKN